MKISTLLLSFFILSIMALSAGLSASEGEWHIITGMGKTNQWFENDIDESISIREFSLGYGRHFKQDLLWLVSLDYSQYSPEYTDAFYLVGITPRILFTRGRFIFEAALGIVINNSDIDGFNTRLKWSPQANIGFKVYEGKDYSMVLSYALSHYSHTFLSNKRNIALHTNTFRLTFIYSGTIR